MSTAKAHRTNCPWLKRGTTRIVILVGAYAIKLPTPLYGFEHFLLGLVANMRERRWWRDAQKHPHVDPNRRLCPVVASLPGGLLVVMKRAYVPGNFQRKFVEHRRGYPDFKGPWIKKLWVMFEGLPFDPKPSNFGFIGRHLVLIDYGS